MNYYISDLHFFCNSQVDNGIGVNYDNRPFKSLDEMHTCMLQRWNAKVTNADTVYILGDVALRGRRDALIGLVAQLKGKKVLIRGNHDDLSDYRYSLLFHEILDLSIPESTVSFPIKTPKIDLDIVYLGSFIFELLPNFPYLLLLFTIFRYRTFKPKPTSAITKAITKAPR